MTQLTIAPQVHIHRASFPQQTPDPPPRQALVLITAVIETMMGRRPLHQLRPHLAVPAFRQLVGYVDDGGFRTARMGGLRTQMPTIRSVEASVRLATSARWLTCVIRLDAPERLWRCSDLYVLFPNPR